MYTGLVVATVDGTNGPDPKWSHGSEARNGSDLVMLEPSLALSLLPHATALLMEDLKRLCEAVLVAVCDAENAEALQAVAEACYAERLLATCEQVGKSGKRRG